MQRPSATVVGGPLVIRASTTPRWADCQLAAAVVAFGPLFEAAGFQLLRPVPNIGALVGSGLHGGAFAGLSELMVSGTLAPLSVVVDASVAEFRARLKEETAEGSERDVLYDGDTKDKLVAERQLLVMSRAYHEGVLQKARPVSVESRIEAVLRPGVLISGQGDLLHVDQPSPAELLVQDAKTGRQKRRAFSHAAQVGTYSLLYQSQGFPPPTGAQIDFILRAKLGDIHPGVVHQPLNIEACENVASVTLNEMADKGEAFARDGDPSRFLVNPSSRLCDARFCRAFGSDACCATRGAVTEGT